MPDRRSPRWNDCSRQAQRAACCAIALALFVRLSDDAPTMAETPSPGDATSPRTTLPNARQFPRFAGISTFCRFPLIDQVPPHQQPVDWALYGVPFDLGVTYRPGTRFGPRAIRDESQYIKPVHLEHGINLSHIFSMAD